MENWTNMDSRLITLRIPTNFTCTDNWSFPIYNSKGRNLPIPSWSTCNGGL